MFTRCYDVIVVVGLTLTFFYETIKRCHNTINYLSHGSVKFAEIQRQIFKAVWIFSS